MTPTPSGSPSCTWRSREDLDASIAGLEGDAGVARVRALVADGGMIELDLIGGKGPIGARQRDSA